MKKILSIIIPTYNMESLLTQCLNSLLVSKNLDMLEVLVVNDGSIDKSSQIAHQYEVEYSNSFRVIDKANGNYGSCINAALPLVKGKYVRILDADDSYNTENLNQFIDFLSDIDVDLVLSDFSHYNMDGKMLSFKNFNLPLNQSFDFQDIPLGTFLPMHSVTYKSSIFDKIEYHQTEGVSYTDMEWIFYPMSQVNTVYYYNKEIYRYLVGRDGQTMDFSAILKRQSHAAKGILTELNIINKFDSNNKHYAYLDYWFKFRLKSLYKENLLYKCINFNLKEFDDNLKKNYPQLANYVNGIQLPIKHTNLSFPLVKVWRSLGSKKLMSFHPLFLIYKVCNKI